MNKYKVTFSDNSYIYIRKATMSDKRLSTQDLESRNKAVSPEMIMENLLRFIVLEAYDTKGTKIEIGQPPVNLEKFLTLQNYHELIRALDDTSFIADTKKKAKLEMESSQSSTHS